MQQFSSTYGKALPWLLLIFVALYFFELASFPLSIDEETAAFRTDPSVWISQGRWGAYLIELLVLPQPSIPVIAPAMFGLGCAFGYLFVLDAARGRRTLQPSEFLIFAVFCAYPTLFFISEFYANLPGTGIALALAAASVWLLVGEDDRPARAYRFVLATLAAAFAIGIYQSFLFATVAMLIGTILLRLVNRLTATPWRDATYGLASIGLAAITYIVADKGFRLAFPVRSPYFDGLWNLELLISSPTLVISRTFARLLARMVPFQGILALRYGRPASS